MVPGAGMRMGRRSFAASDRRPLSRQRQCRSLLAQAACLRDAWLSRLGLFWATKYEHRSKYLGLGKDAGVFSAI